MNGFPFFYYDLTARIVPGVLTLALLRLTSIPWPEPWRSEWPALQYALGQPVLLPVVYGGAAYIIGLILDVLLGRLIKGFYEGGFRRAATNYEWFTNEPIQAAKDETVTHAKDGTKQDAVVDLRVASRWCFDAYLVRAEKDLPGDVPHVIRFHAELKCFAHASAVFGLFIVVGLVGAGFDVPWANPPTLARTYLGAALVGMIVSASIVWSRAERRAAHMLSFIDHHRGEPQRELRDLQARIEHSVEAIKPRKPAQ